MRHIQPRAVHAVGDDGLDAVQLDDLGRAETREVGAVHRRQGGRGGVLTRSSGISGEVFDIILHDAAFRAAAPNSLQIHAEFARKPPDGRACPDNARGFAPARGGLFMRRGGRGGLRCLVFFLPARRRPGFIGRLRRHIRPGGGIHQQQRRAFADLVAQRDMDCLDDAGDGRRQFHRRFFAFKRDNGIADRDGVARLDQNLDDIHFVKIAEIGDGDGLLAHAHARSGEGLSASMR